MLLQEQNKSTLWSTPGVNIDLSPSAFKPKTASSSNTSMNQMTTSTVPGAYGSPQQTKPNYNVNLSGINSSMGSMSMGTGPGMGMRPQMMGTPMGYQYGGMGTGMPGGMGMGMSGGMGMGTGMSGGMGMGTGMSGGMGMGTGMSGGMGTGMAGGGMGMGTGMPYMMPGGGYGMRPS